MKKVVYICLAFVFVFVFSLTTTVFAAGKGEESMSVIVTMGTKTVIMISEDGNITPELLYGFLISLERLKKTYVLDEHSHIVLHHSSKVIGGTGLCNSGYETCQFYGHFCDGRRDISKKLYR